MTPTENNSAAGAQKMRRRFRSAARRLQAVLDEAKEVWPGAELYVTSSTLHLMTGPHHEGRGEKAQQDRSVESVIIRGLDGGDW